MYAMLYKFKEDKLLDVLRQDKNTRVELKDPCLFRIRACLEYALHPSSTDNFLYYETCFLTDRTLFKRA